MSVLAIPYYASRYYKMIFLLLLSFLCPSTASAQDRHSPCPCHSSIYKGINTSDCIHRQHIPKLTSIPDCIPNTTQCLLLSENDLRYTPGQFQRFKDLQSLYLESNINFAAHTDSFLSLTQLEILYLDDTDFTYLAGEVFVDQSYLWVLHLTGNNGHLNVTKDLFTHLGNLEKLDFSLKEELEIPNYLFIGLPKLVTLDLGYIRNLSLYTYSFSGLPALKNLYLDYSLTTQFPEEVFRPLTSLEELNLEGLCMGDYQAPDCITIDTRLQHVPSLKTLFIDKGLISYLGKGFLSLRNLEELYLGTGDYPQSCEIAVVRAETFQNLANSPLTDLSLDQCNIRSLHSGWFKYLTKLREISLAVTTISCESFWINFCHGLEKTKVNKIRLSLTSGRISLPKPLPVLPSFNQIKLVSLELTDTNFYLLNASAIMKLPKSLQHLNLAHNFFIHIDVEALSHLENLKTLDLSNQVEFQDGDSVLTLRKNKKKVRQRYPSLFRFQQRRNATRTKCLSLPYRLKFLDLSKSRLLCNMVAALCDSNNSLEKLDASEQRDGSCFGTYEFWNILRNLVHIEVLNLNGNMIAEIPRDSFSRLHKLREISLINNKLIELSFDVKDLVSLEIFNLSINSIRYAASSFTSQIEEVAMKTNVTLYLNKNPLVCNCKQIDFVTWLRDTNIIWKKNDLNCTFENGTAMRLSGISHVHYLLESQCIMLEVTIGCVAMFSVLNLIFGGIAYFWHNHQKLRYLLSFGRRTLNPYHPIEDCEIQMEYDVYISYEGEFYVSPNMTLRDFVIQKILPGLERRGVRVMLREELDAGRNLYEVITQAVRRSKKVLVLLSRDYCQDMWNVFEFNQAVMEGIYTNRQVAIPVSFETLGFEHVKEEMYAFLRMEPIHRYSPDLSDREFINFLYERISDTRKFG